MTPLALFRVLRSAGVILRPDGDRLHVDAPAGVLTDALRQAMRQQKESLLGLVEWYEERAAIAEYCGGLSRPEAEALAWDALNTFAVSRPPASAELVAAWLAQ
jgi:hypothetical protein